MFGFCMLRSSIPWSPISWATPRTAQPVRKSLPICSRSLSNDVELNTNRNRRQLSAVVENCTGSDRQQVMPLSIKTCVATRKRIDAAFLASGHTLPDTL